MELRSIEEELAASAVASLSGWKRQDADKIDYERPSKILRPEESQVLHTFVAPLAVSTIGTPGYTRVDEITEKKRILQSHPFFYYRNFSQVPDDDPLTPLTPPARVPNFPAKMHAILSRPDLSDIVAWMPHGRSWRVLKPREFEVKIIPTYFEHQKFSSFIRQANGWGFRRITQGRDRNSYYHELFLRSLPHLCKKMKRPGVSKKAVADPDHEPDFYKISEMHQVPSEAATDELTLLPSTVIGGPKARMPVHFGALPDYKSLFPVKGTEETPKLPTGPYSQFPQMSSQLNSQLNSQMGFQMNSHVSSQIPQQMEAAKRPSPTNTELKAIETGFAETQLMGQEQSSESSDGDLKRCEELKKVAALSEVERMLQHIHTTLKSTPSSASESFLNASLLSHQPVQTQSIIAAASLAASNQQAVAARQAASALQLALQQPQINDASSQFAAGFAAATALNNNHVRSVINQALAASNAAATSAAIQALYGTAESTSQSASQTSSSTYSTFGSGSGLDNFPPQGFR
uniref:HSF-type DNA-binding domain-containing protein n=1 Tax=Eucampia antarctica TaxID=49252 RepID=A0A7S2R2A8_9STRA|mmetsp:Transcript_14581/g.14053  ORF Transcript_14581/g.14053 Transcript_14581/m.14053 type:complete len:519 (+) Transcript_14581:143-1699(+)|eukprot:CAMPEP_0197834454 /NCGR_PEP_ID=MMETSP1437-20131217/22431_1 /TAXON_ID=49252 ORGANISM="Eucampia antarctica, Strain CCMP1452" /NCGR_SAMPLE_ID=MMETSP1437 /ASSEMBLY_ACC=CAM_ASM_001096 /LENGTH=518 /DNA_ID=CAMNT_0043439141 /DNA_START=143 /DNA_END=1699 /DNA_ORIENTATION=+